MQCRAAFRAVEIQQIGTKMQSLCSEHHLVILILLKASATKSKEGWFGSLVVTVTDRVYAHVDRYLSS